MDDLEYLDKYTPVECEEFSPCEWTTIGFKRGDHPIIRMTKPLVFKQGNGAGKIEIIVPVGFECDLASTPRFLRGLFPPLGRYQQAAILHDFLYRRQDLCSRMLADAIFREAMMCLGVSLPKRWTMWMAVRIFGRLCGWRK